MNDKKIKVGPIDIFVFFGGGMLLIECVRECIRRDLKAYVFAVKRHLEEIVDFNKNISFEELLKNENIPYFPTKDINSSTELQDLITDKTIGLGMGEAYIFNENIIQLFKGLLFDFMVIKLPQYRGGAHFTWQILKSDNLGSWNIQIINEDMIPGRFDSGEILMSSEYKIPGEASIPKDYFNAADEKGFELFKIFLDKIKEGHTFTLKKINEEESTFYPRLYTPKHSYINWSWTADELERFIRAFDDPYNGASTFLEGKKIILKKCLKTEKDGKFHPFMAGLIYRIRNRIVYVAARDWAVIIKEIFSEDGTDILNSLKVGQRFFTPTKYLEDAILFNADYDTDGLIEK